MIATNLSNNFEIVRYVVLVSSGLTAGASLYLSTTTMSVVLDKAPLPAALNQWNQLFDSGKIVFPGAFSVNAILLGALSWKYKRLGLDAWMHYTVAALLGLSLFPFTRICMWENVQWLKREVKAAESEDHASTAEEVETRQRMVRWRNDNVIRTTLLCASFGLIAYTALFE